MMLTHAAPNHPQPEHKIPQWHIEALVRAWEWSRKRGLPYSPYIAVKAV